MCSVPLPQAHKFKHVAFTNICERLARSKELTESECGAVIQNHCYNNFFLLDIPRSTVSGIITKGGRPCKVAEQGLGLICRWLIAVVHRVFMDVSVLLDLKLPSPGIVSFHFK